MGGIALTSPRRDRGPLKPLPPLELVVLCSSARLMLTCIKTTLPQSCHRALPPPIGWPLQPQPQRMNEIEIAATLHVQYRALQCCIYHTISKWPQRYRTPSNRKYNTFPECLRFFRSLCMLSLSI